LCHSVLHHQFKKSKNVKILKKALGSAVGFADLNFSGTDSTATIRDDWGFKTEDKVRVEVTTVDNMIEEFGCPKFLKVDVEGFENEVFQGLSRPIELIYFEMHGKEVDLAIKILNRLEGIGEIEGVKAISGDNSTWLIDQWCKPNNLINQLGSPLPRHANLIVKMKV
jgi:FkbM family methyltransferase